MQQSIFVLQTQRQPFGGFSHRWGRRGRKAAGAETQRWACQPSRFLHSEWTMCPWPPPLGPLPVDLWPQQPVQEKQSAADLWITDQDGLSTGPFKLTSGSFFAEFCSGSSSSSFRFLACGSSEGSVDFCGELLLVLFVLFEYSTLKTNIYFRLFWIKSCWDRFMDEIRGNTFRLDKLNNL